GEGTGLDLRIDDEPDARLLRDRLENISRRRGTGRQRQLTVLELDPNGGGGGPYDAGESAEEYGDGEDARRTGSAHDRRLSMRAGADKCLTRNGRLGQNDIVPNV